MDITLIAPGKIKSQIAEDVMTALDARHIVYDAVFITECAWPRLTAGTSGQELVAEEILENLDRIQEVAQMSDASSRS